VAAGLAAKELRVLNTFDRLHVVLSIFAIREYRICVLKPQDLLVVIRLALAVDQRKPTFQALSVELGMSASEVHASVERAAESGFLDRSSRKVNRKNLLEFLVHGARFSFPAKRLGITRGVPTCHAAPPLKQAFADGDLPPVWPHPEGAVRGEGIEPLYRSVPTAALSNPVLYEWLVLVDAIRAGRARERALAVTELTRRLST
jgi:DNA-binding Lrp family transcriptional regulator